MKKASEGETCQLRGCGAGPSGPIQQARNEMPARIFPRHAQRHLCLRLGVCTFTPPPRRMGELTWLYSLTA